MTKREMIDNPDSVWNKAGMDEPIFCLRAQDLLAPPLVERWADQARYKCPREKTDAAYQLAKEMRMWPNRKMPD
jgi:hypothetical protein